MVMFTLTNVMALDARADSVESPPPTPAIVRAELPQRLHDLDSPSYQIRCRAARCLECWIGSPELAAVIADEFQRYVLQPELPMEARWRIVLWRGRLPAARIEPPQSQSRGEIQRLVGQLDDDSYAMRTGARERLQWLAGSRQLAPTILLLLKQRMADPALGEDSYHRIEQVRGVIWANWFTNDPGGNFLPPATSRQIELWLDDLVRAGSQRDFFLSLRRRIARQSLMDALAQDADLPRVKAAIETRLHGKLDADAAIDLKELSDMTRPSIVAECWSQHKQTLEQHLIVGQPSHAPGAEHPSHFDHADDREAHCASGNALLPGNYPVGVAFPAPHWPQADREAVFHLVNLPTPRRQIAYSFYVKTDPVARLTRISRRTLDRILAEKKLMNDQELGMLGQLDAREVSKFAARYFFLVEDGTVEEEVDSEYSTSRKHLGSESSRFGSVCAQLAIDGTRDALPSLVDAIRQKRFLPPTPLAPYRLEWLAAFSIARRDPWLGVDAWLAENLDNRQTLDIGHNDSAEIGATAAGLLLERNHENAGAFGLRLAVDPHLQDYKVSGYTYEAADDVQKVRKWWALRAESGKKAAAAP
jgi:hypothetical protein